MPNRKEDRNHHFVPRSCLRRFSIKQQGKAVWAFDKTKGNAFRVAIENAGSENDFYTVKKGGERISYESAWGGLDSAIAMLFDRLENTKAVGSLSDEDRSLLCQLAAFQMSRTPRSRQHMTDLMEGLRTWFAEQGMIAPEMPDEEQRTVTWLRTAYEHDDLAKAMLDKDICILQAPKGEHFWISDEPITKRNIIPFGLRGVASMGIALYWPINPRLSLMFSCPSHLVRIANGPPPKDPRTLAMVTALMSEAHYECADTEVEHLNSLQLQDCTRFIYSGVPNFDLAEEIAKCEPRLLKRPTFSVGDGPPPHAPQEPVLFVEGKSTYWLIPVDSWRLDKGGVAFIPSKAAERQIIGACADIPHQKAEIYDGGQARIMLRGTRIVPVSNHREFRLEYADEAQRRLAEQLDSVANDGATSATTSK